MFSNERGDACHEGGHVQKNVEKDVKTFFCSLTPSFPFILGLFNLKYQFLISRGILEVV